ncbi:type II toxin-antitoxin system Phd/YefM family antitoxin [Tsukamurella sp. M9C]|uniref:type II toxin-antitoxin system Phd/YefM family antitoxin n=1 Tax=unclassified Tsukamurella TaxID=2633480 RepID=UPI001CCB7D17|nr:type II toxin-antitoxin system Phd/YefM family antitoxin [Tsukamurella sp. M9C]MCA0158257.1 type II toxin-antitoxin system Phd/YefM family antitoxin [Tsukamurella sp. M9C]
MKSITVAELRQNPTAALAEVENGETYEVTRHRRVVARLVPPEPAIELIPPKKRGGARLSERPGPVTNRSVAEIDELLREMREDR